MANTWHMDRPIPRERPEKRAHLRAFSQSLELALRIIEQSADWLKRNRRCNLYALCLKGMPRDVNAVLQKYAAGEPYRGLSGLALSRTKPLPPFPPPLPPNRSGAGPVRLVQEPRHCGLGPQVEPRAAVGPTSTLRPLRQASRQAEPGDEAAEGRGGTGTRGPVLSCLYLPLPLPQVPGGPRGAEPPAARAGPADPGRPAAQGESCRAPAHICPALLLTPPTPPPRARAQENRAVLRALMQLLNEVYVYETQGGRKGPSLLPSLWPACLALTGGPLGRRKSGLLLPALPLNPPDDPPPPVLSLSIQISPPPPSLPYERLRATLTSGCCALRRAFSRGRQSRPRASWSPRSSPAS